MAPGYLSIIRRRNIPVLNYPSPNILSDIPEYQLYDYLVTV
jgi:hypothetical protein